MGAREYSRGYSHGLTGRFPLCHRKGRPYNGLKAARSYHHGYLAGAEVARQQRLQRPRAQPALCEPSPT